MSTRSCITFYERDEHICSVYQHYDGYPEGVGARLVEFINSRPFVNGIQGDRKVFNGFGCFVAQFISAHKTNAGGLSIRTKWTRKSEQGEDYVYKVIAQRDSLYRVCHIKIQMLKGRLPSGFQTEFDV